MPHVGGDLVESHNARQQFQGTDQSDAIGQRLIDIESIHSGYYQ
jgi:hypothetical protein